MEALQYDESARDRFLAEIDSPLPGQRVTESQAAQQAESEMEMFRQAQRGK